MDRYYTAGELAKISGVSSRTIRFYDEKGILKPSGYSEGDYRLYDKDAVIVLQQILMLKYVGFSLEEIREVIKQDQETSLKEILEKQKGFMLQKRAQMDRIIYALESAVEGFEKDTSDLEHFTEIMQLITKNDFANQRYGMYEKYNPRQREWFTWRFDVLELKENRTILDVGCGHGLIWTMNWERIPAGCEIVLLDKTKQGLDFLKSFYGEHRHRLAQGVTLKFVEADAEEWDFSRETYDCILTNHFWGYVQNKTDLMKRLFMAIKHGGIMSSTIASLPKQEDIQSLLKGFVSEENLQQFSHEKLLKKTQLETEFSKVFDIVEDKVFDNLLSINQPEDVYKYLISENNKVRTLLDKKNSDFLHSLRKILAEKDCITIGIISHLYICRKKVER